MADENLIHIIDYRIVRDEKGNFVIPDSLYADLRSKGLNSFTLRIMANPEEDMDLSGMDADIYRAIMERQKLPGSVVLEFLNAKGSLKAESEFYGRKKNA